MEKPILQINVTDIILVSDSKKKESKPVISPYHIPKYDCTMNAPLVWFPAMARAPSFNINSTDFTGASF